MEMRTGVSEQARQQLAEGLSRWLADIYTTYLKTQNYHWNGVAGPAFYAVHLLFEKQYEELAEETDEVAERIRALGFFVDATFNGFKKLSTIKEDDKVLNIREMLINLIEAHETVARHGRQVSSLAEKENDVGTVDMIGRRVAGHEKMAWMLRSSL